MNFYYYYYDYQLEILYLLFIFLLTLSSLLFRSLREIDAHTLQARHSEELSRVLMVAAQEQDAVRVASEERHRATQLQLETLRIQSGQRIAQLEAQLSDISQARSALDFNSKDQLKEIVSITGERDRLFIDVEKLTAYKVHSEELNLKLERDLAKATSKIEALQFQVQDKDELVVKSQALQRASDDARMAVEEKLKLYMETNNTLQEKVRELTNEISKGNQVISSQQQDIRQLRDKIHMKGDVIRRQVSR